MDELVKMIQTDKPLLIPSLIGGRETSNLNLDEYRRLCPPCIGMRPNEFITKATSELVIINSLALAEILMDAIGTDIFFGQNTGCKSHLVLS
ncbi:hypothetical protein GIB67_031374, partial [Kingdonia uniflora]